MNAPPISSIAPGETEIDIEVAFADSSSLRVARDVVKGVLLKHFHASFDGHDICFTAQQILSGDMRYGDVLILRDSELPADRTAQDNIVQLPYSGSTIGPTFQPTTRTTMGQIASPLNMSNNHSHFQSGNSLPTFNDSNFRPRSSFNVAQTQTELPQVANLLRTANNQMLPYPHMNNNIYSLSSNQYAPQEQQVMPGVEYPRKLETLFSRTNSILALQNTNSTNRSNVQQQMIAQLQQGSLNFTNQSYLNSNTTYSGQGSTFNLETSISNSAIPSNLALPPLAPAQSSPHLENLLIVESRSTTQSRSETPLDSEMTKNTNPKKRKAQTDDQKAAKKAKVNKTDKADKLELMKDRAKFNLPVPVWMRILEFCPPLFFRKARLVSREWRGWIDEFSSIHTNCRRENFGYNMPEHIPGLSAKQYVDLLGGKGCMEAGCKNKDASRTHWAWKKRWCLKCWKGKIEREDRIQKQHQLQYSRAIMDRLLECIPVGMYDSFGKPHDYVPDGSPSQPNPIATHRLYKYYLISDVDTVIKEYEALTPDPWREDPNHDAQQKAAARQIWEDKMAKLDADRDEFFEEKKAENEKLMQLVIQIEAAIRERRAKGRKPNDANRESRRTLFLEGAKRDIPEIPEEFVLSSKAFRAAIRIFRDGGSERGWRTLMPKIVEEHKNLTEKPRQTTNPASDNPSSGVNGVNSDDVQMTGNNFGNFDLDNDNFSQPNNHRLQQNTQQSQLQGFPVQKSTGLTNNKSLNMIHTGGSVGYRNNFMPSGSGPSNTTPTTFLNGRPPILSHQNLNNRGSSSTMSGSSSNNISSNNNGSSVSSLSNNNNGFSTSSLNQVSRNNNGFSSSSLTHLSQSNNRPSIGLSSNVSHNNNGFSTSSLNRISQNNNGSSSSSSSSVSHYNNSFNPGPLRSLMSGNQSNYTPQNINTHSVSSSSYVIHNNNSSLGSANSSNVGSPSTPRTTMSIASLITRTQPQGS
ncbi:hypothetical protein NHQ30_002960 [Ciborinia camelliae]|nr:hypothetical protein NHQ30_002960 [Ciborinia camelliae]